MPLRRPPHLMDELVEECLLRLPPNEPASLVRAALVCKRWRRLLADRGFRRRFRDLHHGRTAPMLGFLHVPRPTTALSCVFKPTSGSSFRARTAAYFRGRRAVDSRHGRVLLAYSPYQLLLRTSLTVWDPITGEQVDLPGLPLSQHPSGPYVSSKRTAVLCAAGAACDHVDCHRGHFVVVLLHTSSSSEVTVCAHVYSSEAGAWSQTTSVALGVFLHPGPPCALVGSTLYFSVSMIGNGPALLKYDLGTHEIGVVDLPHNDDSADDRRGQILLTTREDGGGLGVARVEKSKVRLWSMDGVLGWAPSGVIELATLLPVRANTRCAFVVSFVHGLGAFFVQVNARGFTVDLVSRRVRKVADNKRILKCFVPYTSFCIPAFKDGRNQVHGV